ncbi:ankyrin repeat domain-containing protein [Orientia tsutsugamushi]|uniref:Ankyrin repeat protein with 4 ankyrin repeats n=1 Tax=Orientia tsutsugamushi (strain Boryong) TaxID=357244 RepID=A5CCB9_ORITB|nr:ankyrin repeat protein with 4 ankyrin repeats [Orientia tsutsugamushi str. Boryong]
MDGDIEQVKKLILSKDGSINGYLCHVNFLSWAVLYNQKDIITFLLKNDLVNIDMRGKSLHTALECNNEWTVRYLSDHDSVNVQDNCFGTPMHTAIKHKWHDDVLMHLLSYCTNIDLQDSLGYAPIHTAVECHNIGALTLLLNNGAKVDSQNKNGKTALHVAAECVAKYGDKYHDMNSIYKLLAHHADVDIKDNTGNTYLYYLYYKKDKTVDDTHEVVDDTDISSNIISDISSVVKIRPLSKLVKVVQNYC